MSKWPARPKSFFGKLYLCKSIFKNLLVTQSFSCKKSDHEIIECRNYTAFYTEQQTEVNWLDSNAMRSIFRHLFQGVSKWPRPIFLLKCNFLVKNIFKNLLVTETLSYWRRMHEIAWKNDRNIAFHACINGGKMTLVTSNPMLGFMIIVVLFITFFWFKIWMSSFHAFAEYQILFKLNEKNYF